MEGFELPEKLQERVNVYERLRSLGMTLKEAQFLLMSYGWVTEDHAGDKEEYQYSDDDYQHDITIYDEEVG